MSEKSDELRQLAELHRNGAISDEEYTDLKRQVIDDKPSKSTPVRIAVGIGLLFAVSAAAAITTGILVSDPSPDGRDAEASTPRVSDDIRLSATSIAATADPDIVRLDRAAAELNAAADLLPEVASDAALFSSSERLREALERAIRDGATSCEALEPQLQKWKVADSVVKDFVKPHVETYVEASRLVVSLRSIETDAITSAVGRTEAALRNWRQARERSESDLLFLRSTLSAWEKSAGVDC